MTGSAKKRMPWLLVLLLIGLGVIAYVKFYVLDREVMTQDILRSMQDTLVGHDLRFVSRGTDFAHYEVTVIGSSGDTVRAHYRVPAASGKIPGVLWIYDTPEAVDPRDVLDVLPEAEGMAILCLNIYDFFGRKDHGGLVETQQDVAGGMARSKRATDLLLQILKKHTIVDSLDVFLAGEGLGALAVIPAAASLPYRLRGVALIDFERGLDHVRSWQRFQYASPKAWANELPALKLAVIEADSGSVSAVRANGPKFRSTPVFLTTGVKRGTEPRVAFRAGIHEAMKWINREQSPATEAKTARTDAPRSVKLNK